MLGCAKFLGCFGSCEKTIGTGIMAAADGVAKVAHTFNNVEFSAKIQIVKGEEILLKNDFTPGILHTAKITEADGKAYKVSFKIRTQCL